MLLIRLSGLSYQQGRETAAHLVDEPFLNTLSLVAFLLAVPLNGLTHKVVNILSRVSINLLAEEAVLHGLHPAGIGLWLSVGPDAVAEFLHVAGVDLALLRCLGGRELVDDVDDGGRTTIDIGDIVEEEVAHESRAHHFLGAYLARDEHHGLGVERHHLAVLILTDDGEEVEQLADMSLAGIGVAAASRRVGSQSVGHRLIVGQRAGGVEVEHIVVFLAVIGAVSAFVQIGGLCAESGLHVLRRTLHIAQDEHGRPLWYGNPGGELSH